jgi:hypothetical protein
MKWIWSLEPKQWLRSRSNTLMCRLESPSDYGSKDKTHVTGTPMSQVLNHQVQRYGLIAIFAQHIFPNIWNAIRSAREQSHAFTETSNTRRTFVFPRTASWLFYVKMRCLWERKARCNMQQEGRPGHGLNQPKHHGAWTSIGLYDNALPPKAHSNMKQEGRPGHGLNQPKHQGAWNLIDGHAAFHLLHTAAG